MKLSTRSRYGLRAMLDLAMHHGGGPIKRQDIAKRQEIPEAYLVQLFVTLRNHGLVKTLRGPSGGHLLTKEPQDIASKEIINAFEGDAATAKPTSGGELLSDKVINNLWGRVTDEQNRILEQTSLADLVEQYRTSSQTTMYHI